MKPFNAVKAKEKSLKVSEREERFPDHAVLTLSSVEEGKSKMIELSTEAVRVLGLTEENSRIGIARGYTDDDCTVEALFLFATDQETIGFVNEKENEVKLDTARLNFSTHRAMSSKIHGMVSDIHSRSTENVEKYFLLTDQREGGYWRLEELTVDSSTSTVIPASEIAEVRNSVGEDVETTMED